jgi:hypothetical protein
MVRSLEVNPKKEVAAGYNNLIRRLDETPELRGAHAIEVDGWIENLLAS